LSEQDRFLSKGALNNFFMNKKVDVCFRNKKEDEAAEKDVHIHPPDKWRTILDLLNESLQERVMIDH